jgi:hypothetical protein
MKAHLMYPDRDFDPKGALPSNAASLIQDLELDTLFEAMAAGDEFLLEVSRRAVLLSLEDPATILYRQRVLADCLVQADVVRRVYGIAVEALEGERKIWGWTALRRSADATLHRSLEVMRLFLPLLMQLRQIAEGEGARFQSDGFGAFWAMLSRELSDAYLRSVEDHLQRLTFPEGVLISARMGADNKGTDYVLREPPPIRSWWERLRDWRDRWVKGRPASYIYVVADRDEAGHRALGELRNRGTARVAAALARSADHVLAFFGMLRSELAFYIACINLRERLTTLGLGACTPEPLSMMDTAFATRDLYDIALALKVGTAVVGNEVQADEKCLVMITGANRGGKSTLLRSIGQAHLMMQCGLFVAAASFRANVCRGIFTHYKREEDASMRSGKLDEELKRMSSIVDRVRPRSLLLCNESFASTNEREGSEIAGQIVRALLERGVKVFYVTHLFELAQGFCRSKMLRALFLRAQRLPDGRRTFRIEPGDPLPTSFGQDLYRTIFISSTRDGKKTPNQCVSPASRQSKTVSVAMRKESVLTFCTRLFP